MKHSARKPATVVTELPTTEVMVLRNRVGHGPVFVPLKADLLLGVAVPEKDGIVHGHGQLQNGGQTPWLCRKSRP